MTHPPPSAAGNKHRSHEPSENNEALVGLQAAKASTLEFYTDRWTNTSSPTPPIRQLPAHE